MFHWSRLGGSFGGGGGQWREAPIPVRERSLRAAASHSRLLGDGGAPGTSPE